MTSNNWLKVLLLIGTLFFSMSTTITANHPATVPISFKRIGVMTETLSYAHLHLTLDLEEIFKIHREAKAAVNATAQLAFKKLGRELGEQAALLYNTMITAFEPTDNLMEVLTVIFGSNSNQDLLAKLDEHMGLIEKSSIPEREKRQVMAAIMGVTTIFNTGLSIYNTIQINELQNRQDHLETGLNRVIEVLREEDRSIEAIKGAIRAYNETLIDIGKNIRHKNAEVDLLESFSVMHNKIEAANLEFQLFTTGVLELLNGKFSPLLVHKQNLLDTFTKFRLRIEREGFQLVYDFPSSIFKADISYISKNNVIDVYIHCPIQKSTPLTLYQYLPLPIVLDNAQQGPLIFIEPRNGNDLLMLDRETHRGAEMKTSFLAGCHIAPLATGNIYMCQDRVPIMKRDTSKDCLGLLFSGTVDQEKILEVCDVVFSSQTTYAHQIDRKTFIVYSKELLKLTIFCDKSMNPNITSIQGLHIITVNPGCQADLDGLLMYGMYGGLEYDAGNLIHLPVKLTFTNDLFPVTELFDVYSSLKKIHLPEKVDFRNLDRWAADNSWRYHASAFGTIGYTLMMAAILGVVGYLLYAYWKYRRARTPSPAPQQPPAGQGQEMVPLHQ